MLPMRLQVILGSTAEATAAAGEDVRSGSLIKIAVLHQACQHARVCLGHDRQHFSVSARWTHSCSGLQAYYSPIVQNLCSYLFHEQHCSMHQLETK
jgi:hypothetical protein